MSQHTSCYTVHITLCTLYSAHTHSGAGGTTEIPRARLECGVRVPQWPHPRWPSPWPQWPILLTNVMPPPQIMNATPTKEMRRDAASSIRERREPPSSAPPLRASLRRRAARNIIDGKR
mmetsp:Transcript_60936/g.161163  ORF Transcript_60936/g.161163 Transcript_60936/m.161163 type:complete len:119 (+) Transcript_60936:247-603(+)